MGSAVPPTLVGRVSRFGSIRFDEFVDHALYHPDTGFFTTLGDAERGRAGRDGSDFITSPEVGPLFGAVLSRWLDARWDELGRPDPYVVVEAGAGRGALAIAVLAAGPICAPALRYVLVERSDVLRRAQARHLALVDPAEVLGPAGDVDEGTVSPAAGSGPLVCSLRDLPAAAIDGVVIANELLDNVPFRLFEATDDSWCEVRVTVDAGRFVELIVPADLDVAAHLDVLAPDARTGDRVPWQQGAAAWLRDAIDVVRAGSVLVVDYAAATTSSLADRPQHEWLRTYRGHGRGGSPLDAPGTQDITVEVAVDQLAAVASPEADVSQADWLRRWGIQAMVEEGNRRWAERAGVGDLAALRARSRAVEAEALCDPTGLGAFRVLEWQV